MLLNRPLLFSVVISLGCSFARAQQAPASSIRHVTVVDVASGEERQNQAVTIENGRITGIELSSDADAKGPAVVDGEGGYLIPGLWDMHVHVHEYSELPLYIANGVTGIRIMAGEKDSGKERIELARENPSPEVYLASAIVDGSPPTWPGSIALKKAEDARRVVDQIKTSGADFIKVYDHLSKDAYLALAKEARQQHIEFAGHVPYAVSAQEASRAGQRSIEHLSGIAEACSKRQEDLTSDLTKVRLFRERLQIQAEGYRSLDAGKCDALLAEFRTNETWQTPTLTVLRVWGRMDDGKFKSDPRLAYVGRKSKDRWQERIEPQMRIWREPEYQVARGIFHVEERVTGALFKARVPMLAGTDAMNPYCFPGFSLHDELALLVEAGLTPLGALQAATINPAKFMRRTNDLGTIEVGKIANLVLLDADPLGDIHNTTRIRGVWMRGKYFDREALAKLLEDGRQAAKH